MTNEPTCLMCGSCCFYLHKGRVVKCGNLIKLKEGKTRCKIYPYRLGKPIGNKMKCGFRKDSLYNFENCPYNFLSPEKPMFPVIK